MLIKIKEILTQVTNIDVTHVHTTDHLNNVLPWDSINSLRVLTLLEKEFNVAIPLYEFLEVKTINDIHKLVTQ